MDNNYNEMFQKNVHVPWMFLDEWKRVYEDVYSSDLERQRRGYEMLLMWKARQSTMPTGAESTLECIHVHIIDQETTQQISKGARPMYAEHDMRLMYSAALMRFLNHVSNVVRATKSSMFKMADKLHIPKWLIKLRHHSAHDASLPSISVLRMGIQVALQWLHENYWKIASSIPVTKASFSNKHIEELWDVWQSIKMYQMNHYEFIDKIPDKMLRINVMKLLQIGDENTDETEVWSEEGRKLTYTADKLVTRLFHAIKADHSKTEKLITLLLESETFIPSSHYITDKEEDLTHQKILEWLCHFWESFLIPFQEDLGLFPTLVHKLQVLLNEEKSKHCQLVMALWIKQLCLSMLKSQAIVSEACRFPSNINKHIRVGRGKKLKPRIHIPETAVDEVLKNHPYLRDGFFAVLNDVRGNSCPIADVKFAVLNPNEFTMIFLPSLLAVANPKIPEASQELLKELVCIAVNASDTNIQYKDTIVYTVHDLYEKSVEAKSQAQFFGGNLESTPQENLASTYDWSTCPLGILPWQRESPCVLDMPSDVTWTLSVGKDFNTSDYLQDPHLKTVIKKVNWQSVVKRRSVITGRLKKWQLYKKHRKRVPAFYSA